MITREKLLGVKLIVTHGNCPDGIMSAMFLHDVLPSAEIQFMHYDSDEHQNVPARADVLFCDFSPPKDRLQEFLDAGTIILDHHKTAKALVLAAGDNGVFGDETADPGVCGAVLAYLHVWLPLKGIDPESEEAQIAKHMAKLSGVRDTWQRQDPYWEQACRQAAVLKFFPEEEWLGKVKPFQDQAWWNDKLKIGELLVNQQGKAVRKALDGAYRFTSTGGVRVCVFSSVKLTSDAAEAEGENSDLVVGFTYFGIKDGQAQLTFSTRSHTTFDCEALCKNWGGGGHTKAAGFSIRFNPRLGVQDPYSVFSHLLERHERVSNKQVGVGDQGAIGDEDSPSLADPSEPTG